MQRKITFCGREITVEFDADAGEESWFDHRAGVGSPGFPPSIEITGFWDGDEYTSLEGIEQQLFDILYAEDAEGRAAAAEAYADQLKEDKLLAKEGEV